MLLTAASLGLRTISMVFQVYLSNLVGAAGIGLLQLTMSVGMLAGTVGTAGVLPPCICVQRNMDTVGPPESGWPCATAFFMLCCSPSQLDLH